MSILVPVEFSGRAFPDKFLYRVEQSPFLGLTIQTSGQADALRARLKAVLWPTTGTLPVATASVETGIDFATEYPDWVYYPNTSAAASVDRLTISLTDDFGAPIPNLGDPVVPCVTPVFVMRPDASTKLCFVNPGHQFNYIPVYVEAVFQALLTAGYTVAWYNMPYVPLPALEFTDYYDSVVAHNAMAGLSDLNPLRLFLDIPIIALNTLIGEGWDLVCATGISGGGWTTPLWAGLDTRIDRSHALSGSVPLQIDIPSRDWEQFLPALSIDYPDLYLLSGHPGRRHRQALNNEGPEGFSTELYEATDPLVNPYGEWEVPLQGIGENMDSAYSIYLDYTQLTHSYSDESIADMMSFFAAP